MTTDDTPRTDAFGNNLVKCYCPRCIVGVHDDIQLSAQYRKHAEWKERAEKAEAEVEKLDKERRDLSRELHLWEMGMYYKPKMQLKIDELKAEVAELNSLMVGWKQRATMSETDLEASKTEGERLREAIVTAYTHNQNMHCYQTKGRLNDELNNQTTVLIKAIKPDTK